MDTAKAIGIIIIANQFEDVRSLEGAAPTTKPCIPIIVQLQEQLQKLPSTMDAMGKKLFRHDMPISDR